MDILSIGYAKTHGGGGGSGMTRTTLYSNDWATTPAETITLTDSYKNYDALEFTVLRTAGNDVCPLEHIISCESIAHEFSGKSTGIVLPFHSTDFIAYYATNDTTLTKVSSGGMVLAVAKIVGVKYAG